MKHKKYNIHITDRYLVWNEKEGCMDWMAGDADKWVESHATLKECFDSMSDWGSRWVMYPSVYIETAEDGEVWESTAECNKCDKCGREEWETMTRQTAMIGKTYEEFEEAVSMGL